MKKICITIAPTNNCNLHCDYCYNHHNRNTHIIDFDMVADIIEKSFHEYDFVDFVWRGGEPLLMNPRFFRKVRRLQLRMSAKTGARFHNSIQTNGTLISKRWIRLFKTKKYDVGISYDGLSNDFHRGKSSDTIHAFDLCEKSGYSSGSISVITQDNLNLCAQYDEIKKHTTHMKFTPCFRTNSADLTVKTEEYIAQLKLLFEHWILDADATVLHPIVYYIREVLSILETKECVHAACLGRMLDIDAAGTVRICSHVADDAFVLGQWGEYASIADIFNGEKFNSVVSMMMKKRNNCKNSCRFFSFCQGGCCSETFLLQPENSDFSCEVVRSFLPYVEMRLAEILSGGKALDRYNPKFIELVQEAICKKPLQLKNLSNTHNQGKCRMESQLLN